VLTDWLIVRRIGAELDRELRGARIEGAGMSADGGFGLAVAGRGRRGKVLLLEPFAPTPLALLTPAQTLLAQPGWPRAIADALEGMRIERIASRRGDRLLAMDFAAQSRFGVASRLRLVVELVPKFGNILLLKNDVVVSAAKDFTRAQNAVRAIAVGEDYEPPPLPEPPASTLTLDEALAALADPASGARAPDALIGALRSAVPLLPLLPARSLVAQTLQRHHDGETPDAENLLRRAHELVAAGSDEADAGAIFVYRDDARITALHTVPLHQYAALRCSREPAILPLLVELMQDTGEQRTGAAFGARVASLAARVTRRREALGAERLRLEGARDDTESAEVLLRSGNAVYAHLGEIPLGASQFVPPSDPALVITLDPMLDAKSNAAALFKRYRKARAKREHAQRRLRELESEEAFAQELAWELERAEPAVLDELADDVERLEHRVRKVSKAAPPRRRSAIEVRLREDARVLVGRSPRGNAELTFRTARPDDLWFHARATPGAHVVLHIDSRRAPHADEVRAAAELAAYHSRGRNSETVAVDYTQRKHVRRRPSAPPGLVWYTDAQTLLVHPRAGATPVPGEVDGS